MTKYFLLLTVFCGLLLSETGLAKKRRKQGPPTSQDAYDFSFPRAETTCELEGRSIKIQLRGKTAETSPEELERGSAFFFVIADKKMALSPSVDSNAEIKFTPAIEGSLCKDLLAVKFSTGRYLFVVSEFKDGGTRNPFGIIWDSKSNKIVDHKKDLKKVTQLQINEDQSILIK